MDNMKVPCELIVLHVLPMIRRGLADELIDRHHLSQTEGAKLLGVTVSTICIYRSRKSGYNERVVRTKQYFDLKYEFESGAIRLINGISTRIVFCQICSNIRESGLMDLMFEIVTGTSSNGRYANRFVVLN
jgi:uncharacterized protein